MSTVRLFLVAIPLSLACSSSDALSSSAQLVETHHVRVGFGVSTFSDDALHLDDPGFATVVKYLDHLHSDHVHVRVPWCRLEPKSGVFDASTFQRVRAWAQTALAAGQDILISVDTHAPYFARRDSLQRDENGDYFDGSGCGSPAVYPDGDPAPAFSTDAYQHYGKAFHALVSCLHGDAGNPGGCAAGTDLLPHVMLEIGDETNWGSNWQTGECESGKRWYQAGLSSDGKSCQNGNGNVGRIDRTDADFYGELANYTARLVHADYDFSRVSLGGVFMHGGDWGSNHPDGQDYLARIYERDPNDLWQHVEGHAWDKVALHFGGSCSDPNTTQWDGCNGSVKDRIDGVRALLKAQDPNPGTAIWITGMLDDGAGGQQAQSDRMQEVWKGIVANYCTAEHPVTMVKFARLPDPTSGSLSNIGFMNAGSSESSDPKTWTPKALYDDMPSVLAQNCD